MDTTKKDPERGKKYKYKVHDNLFVRQITMCSLRLNHLPSFPVKRLTVIDNLHLRSPWLSLLTHGHYQKGSRKG